MSSKTSTPKEFQTKRRSSLELLPKKLTQLDIQEIKRQIKLESDNKQKRDELITKPKSSYHNEEKEEHAVNETTVEPSKYTKQLQRSYQSIDEFMRDIEETPKLDLSNAKLVPSPTSTLKTILQDSSFVANNNQATKYDSTWALSSPKNNKSVLKSASGSIGGLAKKKVIFDLEESHTNKKSTASKSISELLEEEYNESKELNDINWNLPRLDL
jgi:hypothetical protein